MALSTTAHLWKGDPTSFGYVTAELSVKLGEADPRAVIAAGRGIDWQQLTSMEPIQLLRSETRWIGIPVLHILYTILFGCRCKLLKMLLWS